MRFLKEKRKDKLAEDIVIFEKDPANIEIVYRRKRLWSYRRNQM